MAATLEQQLIELARTHNLDGISIGLVRDCSGRLTFSSGVHRNGKCGVDNLYGDNIAEAFKCAINRLNGEPELAPIMVLV